MELTIYKENEMWTAHMGKYTFENGAVHVLTPASSSLYRLITAIHIRHPECKVWIDPNITDNPFLQKTLFTMRHYNLTPIYEHVQMYIDNSGDKICNLCDTRACYNNSVRGWQCTSRRCGAIESFINKGRYFRLSRNARR